MNGELRVPRRFKVLGRAFGRLVPRIEEALDHQTSRCAPATDMVRAAQACSEALSAAIGEITRQMERIDLVVLANERASDHEIHSEVARLWDAISPVAQAHDTLRAMHTHGEDGVAQELLVRIHRHTLGELRDTLRSFSTICIDPETALQRLGPQAGSDGITIELHMHLTGAPEVPRLQRWLAARSLGHAFPAPVPAPGFASDATRAAPRKRWYETWWGSLLIVAGIVSLFDD